VPTQLATPLGTKKKIHTMITDPKNTSDLNPDNIIPVTLDDLSEVDWREFKRGIEEEKAARLKQYFKTRSGAVKKVTTPNPLPALDTKVINSTENVARLVDLTVESTYSSNMTNSLRTITETVASTVDEFKERLRMNIENSLPRQVRSLVLQINDDHPDKQLMPPECLGYTKRVYQRRSPKPASQGGPSGWYGGLPTGRPSCWKDHGGTGRRSLWRIRRQAHGGLPCSTRIELSLGLQVVSAPVPPCSSRQAPL
jgi:hypothetical protein